MLLLSDVSLVNVNVLNKLFYEMCFVFNKYKDRFIKGQELMSNDDDNSMTWAQLSSLYVWADN